MKGILTDLVLTVAGTVLIYWSFPLYAEYEKKLVIPDRSTLQSVIGKLTEAEHLSIKSNPQETDEFRLTLQPDDGPPRQVYMPASAVPRETVRWLLDRHLKVDVSDRAIFGIVYLDDAIRDSKTGKFILFRNDIVLDYQTARDRFAELKKATADLSTEKKNAAGAWYGGILLVGIGLIGPAKKFFSCIKPSL
jgi:hypothetical protein